MAATTDSSTTLTAKAGEYYVNMKMARFSARMSQAGSSGQRSGRTFALNSKRMKMSHRGSLRTGMLLTLAAGAVLCSTSCLSQDLPYQDLDRSFEERAADLVGRMTLEEKISQLGDQAAAIPRLQVPAYGWWNEALHGVARAGAATSFPQAIALSASF